ncbi:MAG: GGDEF domain-containing protein [Deltaproteobacteria bacterium]|nr:GGDEF domain-containing protein [Deltaproteobacteria bacterium]
MSDRRRRGEVDGDPTVATYQPPATLAERDVLAVLVLTGPETGRYFRIDGDLAVIGRGEAVDIRIPDPFVSRRHVRIERQEDGRAYVRDLGSRFGLWVEGVRVSSAELGDGLRIQLSSETVLGVRFQDPAETQLFDQLHQAAMSDALTGLANRRYLLQRLEQELSFSTRHGSPIAVLMLDLDNFKPINDRLGHAAGDDALKLVARALRSAIRLEDVLARYGGDEFVVLSRGYGAESVNKFAERLRSALLHDVSDEPPPVSELAVSIGVAHFDPASGDRVSPMDLLTRADAALYRSKAAGRNRVSTWHKQHERRPSSFDDETMRMPMMPELLGRKTQPPPTE